MAKISITAITKPTGIEVGLTVTRDGDAAPALAGTVTITNVDSALATARELTALLPKPTDAPKPQH